MDFANILEGFNRIIEMLMGCCLFIFWAEKRPRFPLKVAITLVLVISFLFTFLGLIGGIFWYFLVYLICTAICYILCNFTLYEALYCSSLGYLAQHLVTNFYILFHFRGQVLNFSGFEYYKFHIIIYLIIFFYVAPSLIRDKHYDTGRMNAILISIVNISIVIVLSSVAKIVVDPDYLGIYDPVKRNLFLIIQICEVSLCLFVLGFQLSQNRRLKEQEKFIKKETILKERTNQLKISKDNIDSIKLHVHDLKYKLAAISNSEEYKNKYINDLKNSIQMFNINIETGNEALNTILIEKAIYCKTHNIHLSCNADGSSMEVLDIIDIYTLIGNALDNSIEAVEKIVSGERKVIILRILKRDNFITISLENNYNGEIKFSNDNYYTSKNDSNLHGFGIKSIKQIVKKYNGGIFISSEDNIFKLSITIPI